MSFDDFEREERKKEMKEVFKLWQDVQEERAKEENISLPPLPRILTHDTNLLSHTIAKIILDCIVEIEKTVLYSNDMAEITDIFVAKSINTCIKLLKTKERKQ